MNNFTFYNRVKIVFGKDALDSLGSEIAGLGKRVLFVYGKGTIKKIGLYDRVISILKDASKEIVEHSGVKPNPVLSHTKEGITKARQEKVDFILAVGGGSVLDESKAIAAGTLYSGDVWDFFTGDAEIKESVPLVTVLTVPATGSEMNGGMVVTNEETDDKFGLVAEPTQPLASFLDPTLTFSIPKDYTAYSGVDAISHCVEGYFTHNCPYAPVQERYVEGIVRAIMESIEKILEKPDDYDSRAAFMWAASLAWNGLTMAGLEGAGVPSHMLAHPLSALYDMAHGATLSITIPAWMTWAHRQGNDHIERFSRNMFGVDAEMGIEKMKSWFRKIGSPVSLSEAGVTGQKVDRVVEKTFDLAKAWDMDSTYSKEVIRKIYSFCP